MLDCVLTSSLLTLSPRGISRMIRRQEFWKMLSRCLRCLFSTHVSEAYRRTLNTDNLKRSILMFRGEFQIHFSIQKALQAFTTFEVMLRKCDVGSKITKVLHIFYLDVVYEKKGCEDITLQDSGIDFKVFGKHSINNN